MNSRFIAMLLCASVLATLATRPTYAAESYPPRLSGAAVAAAVDKGAGTTEPVAAPLFKKGQQWAYRRVDLWRNEETERFHQEFAFEEPGRWQVLWTIVESKDKERNGSVTYESFTPANHGFADKRIKGSIEALRFPLTTGKTWSFNYDIDDKATITRIKQTASVKGWETVVVPAGTFMALRIEHEGNYSAKDAAYQWNGGIRETLWFAPAAGRIVKKEYQDTKGDGSTWDHWREELVEMYR